ncbi:MAG: hypothetical protein J5994_10185 [Ruminococcus sp.]|nr:hypothetical protein [Ruminococcus sp.]
MAYADYTFYTTAYYGSKISENDFPYFAERASDYIDSLSFAETDEISLAKACCACAEIMYSAQPEKQIASEKVGDYSVSYAQGNDQTSVADELLKTASKYLNLRQVGWI